MQIRKILCLILCLSIITGMLTGCRTETKPTLENSSLVSALDDTSKPSESSAVQDSSPNEQELSLAEELGFPTDKLSQETVSGEEYMAILDRLIELNAPEKLAEWQDLYQNFRNDTKPLDRFNAMVALYLAACHIGNGWEQGLYAPNGFTYSLDHSWDEPYVDGDLFEGVEQSGFNIDGETVYLDYAAYSYALARKSPVSGDYLFSYDAKSNSLRVRDSCTYEEALLSAVRLICSQNPNIVLDDPVFTATEQTELDKAAELGFSLENLTDLAITGEEFAPMLDKYVELIAPEKLASWREMYPLFRADKTPLTRQMAMTAIFLAGVHIGDGYEDVRADLSSYASAMEWEHDYLRLGLFGGYDSFPMFAIGIGGDEATYDITAAPYYYAVGKYSPYNGEFLFSCDEVANSLLPESTCSYADALLAIIRAMCSGDPDLLQSPPADIADSSVLTPALLAKSQSNPAVTADDHPVWNGFVLGAELTGTFDATVKNVNLTADWGFNSVRVMVDYRILFSDYECTEANMLGLSQLDALVAAAIERDLHLNVAFSYVPGRDMYHDPTTFESTGDFDLFINPEKQEIVKRMEATIARRYAEVSNFNLSITPFWEVWNKNLSTGLPAPEYTTQDTADVLGAVVDAIRAETPDRLIIYEVNDAYNEETRLPEALPAHKVAEEKGNMIISYNFCQAPFVYANMTAEEGQHIDNNNHSIYCPQYPTKHYVASALISDYEPMTVDGCLPAGTDFDIYLSSSTNGVFTVTADGEEIFRENLKNREYDVGYPMSGYIYYATSDKKISFTLPKDTTGLKLSVDGGELRWCGMDIYLPEEYARDRWYYASEYDVFLGLEEASGLILKHDARIIVSSTYAEENWLTVNEDLTYTAPVLEAEASNKTIKAWCEAMAAFEGNCVIRFERADFSNPAWGEIQEYYTDLLSAFQEYGFSWWSNDFTTMTKDYPIPEVPRGEYSGFECFNIELLELLQAYQ